ncbi:Small subunit (SSU) processome component [Microbotryomycetes sp. JL221]|nr:Small subunit (SSU) processome component [Microbotryomycetes sp. JL221]
MAKSKQPKLAKRTTTITPASTTTTVVQFSPNQLAAHQQQHPLLYAHLIRSPDGHTVRVYDTVQQGKCVLRWSGQQTGQTQAATNQDEDQQDQHVAAIAWTFISNPSSSHQSGKQAQVNEAGVARGKKRRKSDGATSSTEQQDAASSSSANTNKVKLVLCLGLENGSVVVLSPTDGTAAKTFTLSHPTSTSAITALTVPVTEDVSAPSHIWSAHQDGVTRVWDLTTRSIVAKATGIAQGQTVDDLAVSYRSSATADGDKFSVDIIASHLSLSLYSTEIRTTSKDKIRDLKVVDKGRASGHVDKAFVRWTSSSSSLHEFVSYSTSDRFVQFWSLMDGKQDATLVARLSLDSGAQAVDIGVSPTSANKVVAAVDADGKLSIANVELKAPASPAKGKKASSGVTALQVATEVVGTGESSSVGVVSVAFAKTSGQVVISRGSVKPIFESVIFYDNEDNTWLPKIELAKPTSLLTTDGDAAAGARYTEKAATSARSDALPDLGSDEDEIMANSGELDVDTAEPTLAERLKAMNVSQDANRKKALAAARDDEDEDDSDDDDDEDHDSDEEDDDETRTGPVVPATTLTTTLIQALHSSDAPLLESCLTHSSPSLIRSTVKRLPPGSLVLNLLEALVERLGQGKRGKTSQGAASVKRARGLIEWVKQVLVIHVGFLVTVPSLVTRLAALHASLTNRLALEPSLLALHGRLDLVVSQIDVKRDSVRRRVEAVEKRQIEGSKKGRKYVEGESDDDDEEEEEGDDDEEDDVDMDGEDGDELDDDDEVEDVLLGSANEDDEVDDDDGLGFDDAEDFDLDNDEADDARPSSSAGKVKVNGRSKIANGGIKMGVADMLDLEAEDDEEDEDDDDDDDETEEDDEEEEEEDDESD